MFESKLNCPEIQEYFSKIQDITQKGHNLFLIHKVGNTCSFKYRFSYNSDMYQYWQVPQLELVNSRVQVHVTSL